MMEVTPDSEETRGLLERVARKDPEALNLLLHQYRPHMEAFVAARLDSRLQGRADASDVVQEAQLEVARRMSDFLERRPMPFHLWVRRTAYERLLDLRRNHLRRARRSVAREAPGRSSVLLAQSLLCHGPSPSEQAAATESAERVARAVEGLPEVDREVLRMRTVDNLSYGEIACVLGITPEAARQRYGRALIRLQAALADAGLIEGQP